MANFGRRFLRFQSDSDIPTSRLATGDTEVQCDSTLIEKHHCTSSQIVKQLEDGYPKWQGTCRAGGGEDDRLYVSASPHQAFVIAEGIYARLRSYLLDYFQYYASLQNQANMIQDFSRTQAYRRAILGNAVPAFENKIVIDIGAGQSPIRFGQSFQAQCKQLLRQRYPQLFRCESRSIL